MVNDIMCFESLTPEEQNAVIQLKERMMECMEPEMYEDLSLFVRFLRARDLNLNAAESMLRNHLEWRKINNIKLILTDFTPKEVVAKYIPFQFLGIDKEGYPIIYFNIGNIDAKGILKSCRKIDILRYFIRILEENTQKLKEQSKKLNRTIDKWSIIINLEHLSFGVATHKQSLEVMASIITMYESNYPERLKSAYIIKASYYFTLAFAVVKHFISEKTCKKLNIYGNDGWKEGLLSLASEDVLPAFLGGKRTDPDGNPLCKSFIGEGGTVDPKYYIKKREHSIVSLSDAKRLVVTRMSKVQIPLEVRETGTYLEWEFETKSRDIGFSVIFKKNENDLTSQEIIPKQRIDAHIMSETGTIKCEDIGTYIIEFDNSFSWIFKKEIYYRLAVVKKH